MNDYELSQFLIRFTDWCAQHGIREPTKADVYRFMETNR